MEPPPWENEPQRNDASIPRPKNNNKNVEVNDVRYFHPNWRDCDCRN